MKTKRVFYLYRDNGITIQIQKYQFFTELGSFFVMMVIGVYNDNLVFKNAERSITMIRISEIINVFVMFVIQPLYFLNGDANFRTRITRHGLPKALKMALFNQRGRSHSM